MGRIDINKKYIKWENTTIFKKFHYTQFYSYNLYSIPKASKLAYVKITQHSLYFVFLEKNKKTKKHRERFSGEKKKKNQCIDPWRERIIESHMTFVGKTQKKLRQKASIFHFLTFPFLSSFRFSVSCLSIFSSFP